MFPSKPKAALAAVMVAGLALAGCSRGEATEQAGPAEAFAEPVTITNCDRETTYDAPPQRIISMNDHVTETLIQMGAGDRIVGMGYGESDDVLPSWPTSSTPSRPWRRSTPPGNRSSTSSRTWWSAGCAARSTRRRAQPRRAGGRGDQHVPVLRVLR